MSGRFDRRGLADPMWAESLWKFSRPAAVLARPRPEWQRLSAGLTADDVLHQLEVGYYDADRNNLVQVITHRRRLRPHVGVLDGVATGH
ncbi:hypothetical protein P3T35_002390 [Kitasatospora sp. GP30]|uniref:hypothetical protein n=1 Tax=Kitasatospora sp. GP30 TaxID=3035084 RepID=UPI000C70B151|nr:hypothetical protein [Kitasatospora sp. GP30]MDH6140382.1 hypothetical protein [Kitasatospora sp. GP30]